MMASVSRFLAALVGFGIIGCVVHSAVMASGGYSTTAAPLMMGLAAGLAVGALAVGVAWHEGRLVIAFSLVAALAAGEAWSLLLTAERTIAHRDQHQAPLRAAAEGRAIAAERVKLTEAALAAIESTPRLVEARKAKTSADAAVVSKASERGCLVNCRQLLQAQADAASAEMSAARAEIESKRASAEGRVGQARAELDALPIPQSAAPLADRLGIDGWQVDLVAACLASLAANGLAAFLLAFAAHGRAPRPIVVDVTPTPVAARDPTDEADRFARATFRPNRTGRVKLADIRQAYYDWCRERGLHPLPDHDIGQALNTLFSGLALYRRGNGANAAIAGIDWSRPEPLRLEGP